MVVLTTHTDRKGQPKLLSTCTLPLTARGCVDRIFTDMAVIDLTDAGFVLREIAKSVCIKDVIAATGAPLVVPDGEIPMF